jgi:hypothetical protein
MASGIKVDVYGVRETLAELHKYERETYTRITNDLKLSAKPAAQAVGRSFPDEPLRNWHTSGGRKGNARLPEYNGAKVKNKVRVTVSTRKPAGVSQHGLIRLEQSDAGGQVYDTAGSRLLASVVLVLQQVRSLLQILRGLASNLKVMDSVLV